MAKRLSIVFKTEFGTRATISIQSPKEDLTALEVSNVMDNIIESDSVYTKNGVLTEKVSAKFVDTATEEIELI